MKKIAFYLTSTGWGGLEMNTIKLAKLLKSKGYSISLFTISDSIINTKTEDIFDKIFYVNFGRKYFNFKIAKQIAKILNEEEISIIFAFDNRDLDVLSWAKLSHKKDLKIIYQQHMQMGVAKRDFFHTLKFSTINYWISPLNHLKNEVIEKTKFPKERIKIIPLSVDTEKYINAKYSKNEALDKLKIDPKYPFIGIIGRITEKKGQLFLIESLIKLKKEGINIELLIFGSATVNDALSQIYYQKILNTIKENNLESLVHLVDFQEDVSLFYNSIDVFVLGSESETYGMVTIEAMLSKIPIIATNNGGTPEILDFGKLGKLYKYENYQELKDCLMWHLNNRNESTKMAENAQLIAKKSYSIENEITQIDNLIKSLGI